MAGESAEAPGEGGGGGDSGGGAQERGVAPIKLQYLTTKEQFHEFLEARRQEKPPRETDVGEFDSSDLAEPEAKRIRLEDGRMEGGQTEDGQMEGAAGPQAQKRARGQNKSRPHVKPTHYDENRLCPSLVQESTAKCFFGDRCRFLHDVGRYLETKPADLGPSCVLFETFGRCPYGVTCRFAGAHLGPEGQNLVQEELVQQAHPLPVRNGLDKTLQQQLRKRQVRFGRAEQALRQLSKDQLPGPSPASAAPTATSAGEVPTAEGVPGPGERDSQQAPGPDPGTLPSSPVQTCGALTDEDTVRLRPCEKKRLDISGKLYLAPLTTCGNLPFRRICKRFGADVTCGEMAVCTNLLQGQMSEWALLKRHPSEDIFGVQLQSAPAPARGCLPRCHDQVRRAAEPHHRGGLCGHQRRLPHRPHLQEGWGLRPHEPLYQVPPDRVRHESGLPCHAPACLPQLPSLDPRPGWTCRSLAPRNPLPFPQVLDVPLTVKIRTGVQERVNLAHRLLPELRGWGVALATRYTRLADWQYIEQCAQAASPMPLFGNGDILSYEDANRAMQTGVAGVMIARGALLKPWLFTEIKEQRHWDISSSERMDVLRDFTRYGLEHWGSDTRGVEKTRRFLLEWLSFLCRYVPVGLLERLPQRLNERPPYYLGRDYLETLMASQNAADWIRISEMLLGPVPPKFVFLPKHKANSYK
ncbi:tRNA-dihydrouridine(47) synthase [NAD(P)(+)]-like isoform X2 [Tamandua tetradactyla]|uniref:tRNA-dihydrouridine(47) synthase [NAD(P)(+)]-like isoform X2 n=1 Tax=Tamandua tetradactyla TaxID=48850 RepID=UPI004053C992